MQPPTQTLRVFQLDEYFCVLQGKTCNGHIHPPPRPVSIQFYSTSKSTGNKS